MVARFIASSCSLTRPFRLALVLITLLLTLPQMAWADLGINTNNGSHFVNWAVDNTDVLEDQSYMITYDSQKKELTLNNAIVSYSSDYYFTDAFIAMTDGDQPSITVRLVGDNTITLGDKASFFYGTSITFTTDANNPGSLTIVTDSEWAGKLFVDKSNNEPIDANYQTGSGLSLTQNGYTYTINTSTSNPNYNITIAGTAVTSENASGITGANISGTVTYDADNKILTLNGATLTAPIVTGIPDLTIDIKGTNTITTNTTCIQKMDNTNPSLTFKSTSTEVGSLTLTNNNGGISEISEGSISVSKELAVLLTLYGYNDYTSNLYHITDGSTTVARIVPGYGVSVGRGSRGYTDIYAGNKDDVLGDGKVSFKKETNTLILNNASGIPNIKTYLGTLNIDLIGSNSLYLGNSGSIFESSDGSAVTIKVGSSSETKGNLTLETDDYNAHFKDANVTLTPIEPLEIVSGDLATNNGTLVIAESYGITVGGVIVNATNATNVFPGGANDGKVSFTPATSTAPNTLTLNGATISGSIYTTRENLKIIFKGTNTLNAESNGICSSQNTGTLTFSKEGSDASLNITSSGSASVIRGFAELSHSGLYIETPAPHKILDNEGYKRLVNATNSEADTTAITSFYISESVTYQVWVGGVQITAANSSGTGWSYNNNTTTLTLDNYTAESNDYAFIINMPNLNVYLKGTNTVTFSGIAGSRAFYSTYNNNGEKATLTFSTDENNKGKLDAHSYNTFCEGFRDINGIYCLNGLGYYPSTCKIEAKYTPTMHFAKWNETAQGYTGGNVGASETLETTYGVAFKAPRPEFDDDYQLFADSTRYTYSYNPTGIVEIPITNTDLSGNNTFGDIIINKAGTVTITCTFPGNLQNEACSASYTLKVNKADPTISFKKEGNVITSDNTTYGSNYVFPTLDYPNDITEITYSSSNEAVAKYTNNVWSIVGAGETTITATSTANDCYNSASATLTLTVGKATPTLTFSAAITEATYGEAFTPPTLTKPDDVNVTYRSDNVAVATVNASTGEVTILYPGDAEITASFAGDNNYNAATDASYSIAVHPSAPTLSIESGAYYVGQEITATETVPGNIGSGLYIYQGETFINQVTAPPYTYPFNNVGVFSVKAKTIYVRSGGTNLSPINSEETKATIVINNQPTFTASVGVNAYNETNPQSGNVAVQLEVTNLQANCTLRYYLGNDASKAVNYDAQNPIILSETNTINAYIRYTDNTVTPNIVYDSAPVSKTYTVKQEVVDPFGNDLSYSTCYLANYSLNKPDGIKVYIITGVSGNSVTTTAIDYIPQGVAVLLEKDGNAPAGGYVAETYTGAAGNFSGNMLKYADADVTATDNLYILYKNEFVKATGVIPENKCYLDLNSVNPSRGMYDIGDGTTAIKGITLSEGEEVWYDLQGRRIERPTKPGLYIRNGKKVVVNNK